MIDYFDMIQEFPFKGVFYRKTIDESKPLEERTEEEITILETVCDIQQSAKNNSGNLIQAAFNIYMPLDTNVGITIKRGDFFRGDMYGMQVDGEVIGIYPSQLGKLTIYIKDLDV